MNKVNNTSKTAFFTMLTKAETSNVTKGRTGVRTSSHEGDIYINRQGRLFGLTTAFDEWYDIEKGQLDNGVYFLKIRKSTPTGTDKKNKPTYAKTAFKTSAKTTNMPFITVTKLCRELFGDDKDNWGGEFESQGEDAGWTYYTLMETEVKKVEDKADAKADKKADAKAPATTK